MSAVTVVATVEAGNTPPRVRLDVTDTGTSPSIFATTVTRLNPDGRAVPVRTQDGNPLQLTTSGTTRVGLLYDYEMPYAAPVSFSTLETPGNVTTPVIVPETRVWLIHPGVPALSRPVIAAGISGRTRPATRGVHRPMGAKFAVVQTDGQRKAPEYTLTIRTTTDSDRVAVDALFDDAGVLLLNVPADKQWGVTAEYVSAGDTVEDRLYQFAREQRRTWQLPLIVVDRPAGGAQSQRTLDTLSSFASLNAIGTAYASLNAVLTGP